MRPAADLNTRLRFTKISAGLGSRGNNRCAGNPSTWRCTAGRFRALHETVCSTQLLRAGRTSHSSSGKKEKAGAWPRDPDGAPIYPGIARHRSQAQREEMVQSGAPYALRLDMTAALERTGTLTWTEQGEGPHGEAGEVSGKTRAVGRRHPGSQGHANQLPSVGGRRRCSAGHHACRPWAGFVLGDCRPSPATGAVGFAEAGLSASFSVDGWGRAKVVQIDAFNRTSGIAGARGHAGGGPAINLSRCFLRVFRFHPA